MKLKGKVIIANTGDDTLSFLDIEKREVVDVLDLRFFRNHCPIGPYDLITTGNDLLYCINIYDNSLYKININTKKIIDYIYIGCFPSCIKYFGDNFYIVNTDSNCISIIDEIEFQLIGSISVGDKPTDMEIDRDNMKIYVSNSNDRSISIIDLNTNSNIVIKLQHNPLKLLLEGEYMYILFNGNDSPSDKSNISIMNLKTFKIHNILDLQGIFNTMLKINSSEIIFTTNIGNSCLYRMDIKKGDLLGKTVLTGFPNKLAWDGNRTIYISNISNNTLSLFDVKTNKVVQDIKVGQEPSGILFFN